MRPVLSDERWQAMRELYEIYGVSVRLLSLVSGVGSSTVRGRAWQHKWTARLFTGGNGESGTGALDVLEGEPKSGDTAAMRELAGKMDRPAELSAFMDAQVDAILAGARCGRVDKARIDAVWSMIRMVERAENLGREHDKNKQTRSDDELAEILSRVDQRIVELARDHAERLVCERLDAKTG